MCVQDEWRRIAALAVEALLVEAAATPKPGLVDRHNCGAHADMDFFTFQASAAALSPYFMEFVRTGAEVAALPDLLACLRPVGCRAEHAMYARTGGVNTHRGAIFSFGVLLGAAGHLHARSVPLEADAVLDAVQVICAGLCCADYGRLAAGCAPRTKGEQVYLTYGLTGVRGAAEGGFPLVRAHALPLYRERRAARVPLNDALVDVLLVLMAHNMDTNILGRHDRTVLERVQAEARRILGRGGMRTEVGRMAVEAFDAQLISTWVSPGGSADLVAVTHFLYEMEHLTDARTV